MELILRKKESGTSQILFVFNVFLWDRGQRSAPLSRLLDILGKFGKSETALRMALSRSVQNGFLINEKIGKEIYYSLTESGVSAIEGWREQIGDYFRRIELQGEWDGTWFMVNFNIPASLEGKRGILVRFLQHNKFTNLNKGIWISPYDYFEKTKEFCSEIGIGEFVVMFKSTLLDGKEQENFTTNFWDIEKSSKLIRQFTNDFEPYLTSINGNQNDKGNEIGRLLTLLHEIGWRFMEVVEYDHQLPFTLYPDKYDSQQAVLVFSGLRSAILEQVQEYVWKSLDVKQINPEDC